jgi:hypothetical protein
MQNNTAFREARNVEFKEMQHFEELGGFIDVFKITESSAYVWNVKAERINTKTFIVAHGRQPNEYEEVQNWIKSLINEGNHSAANTMASMDLKIK